MTDSTGERLGEFVLKRLKNADRADRIAQEIASTSLAFKKHVPVIEIVDDYLRSDSDAERPWYVTPRANQGNINSRIVPGAPFGGSLSTALEMYDAIVRAVLALHREQISHRDLKPHNILLHVGQPILCDLGLCLPLDTNPSDRLSAELERIGSIHYTPKEAFSRRPVGPEQLAYDAYALGKLLYDLVAGRTLPAFVPVNDREYDLAEKNIGPVYKSINRTLRSLLHDEPTVRMAALAELLDQTAEMRIVMAPLPQPAGTPTWRSDLLLAVDDLAKRIATEGRPLTGAAFTRELDSLLAEVISAWESAESRGNLRGMLDVTRGGPLQVGVPTVSIAVLHMLKGTVQTRAGLEPFEDRGYPIRPVNEVGCSLGASSADLAAVPFRGLWLVAAASAKGSTVHVAFGIVRRELGERGATDLIPASVTVIEARSGDASFAPSIVTAAAEMFDKFATEVIAELKRAAK